MQQFRVWRVSGDGRDLCNDAVPQITHKLPGNLRWGVAGIQQTVGCGEHAGGTVLTHVLQDFFKDRVGHGAHQLADFRGAQLRLAPVSAFGAHGG